MSAPRLRAYRIHVHVIQTLGTTVVAISEEDAYDQARIAADTNLSAFEQVNTTVWGPYLKRIDDEEAGS